MKERNEILNAVKK